MANRHTRVRAQARTRLVLAALSGLAVPACSAADAISSSGSVTNASGSRRYELHVPAGVSSGEPRPLLVALHGCLQTPEQLAGVARLNELARTEKILVLYPIQSAAANPARCWNWFNPADQSRGSGEPSLIKAMIDEVRSRHSIDASRVYVAGISAGGFMTSILLACYPDVFAGGAIVAGGMYKAAESLEEGMTVMRQGSPHDPKERGARAFACAGEKSAGPTPVLVLDGDADPIVANMNAGQAIAQFAQTNDLADDGRDNDSLVEPEALTRSRPEGAMEYTCREYVKQAKPLLRHCTVHGLAHAWSGGDGRFPYAEPKGPDATSMIWSFFAEQARTPAK